MADYFESLRDAAFLGLCYGVVAAVMIFILGLAFFAICYIAALLGIGGPNE